MSVILGLDAAVDAYCAEMLNRLAVARDLPTLDEIWAEILGAETELADGRWNVLRAAAKKRWALLAEANRAAKRMRMVKREVVA